MKLFLLSLLLLGLTSGCNGLDARAQRVTGSAATECAGNDCDPSGCRVTVECTERGTCIVTCYEPDGSIRCQEEVACDAPCLKECESEGAGSCAPSAG
jgi:hypothetical protein